MVYSKVVYFSHTSASNVILHTLVGILSNTDVVWSNEEVMFLRVSVFLFYVCLCIRPASDVRNNFCVVTFTLIDLCISFTYLLKFADKTFCCESCEAVATSSTTSA
jgi:hypothetical protein